MEDIREPALLLKTIPYSDTSTIAHFFSARGRETLIAKGARRAKSPFHGKLQPLYLTEVVFQSKESREIQPLRQLTLIRAHQNLQKDFTALTFGMGILEVVDQLIIGSGNHQKEFDSICAILDKVDKQSLPPFNGFIMALNAILEHAGFYFETSHCNQCGRIESGEKMFFRIDSGHYLCASCCAEQRIRPNMAGSRLQQLRDLASEATQIAEIAVADQQKIIHFYHQYINAHWHKQIHLNALAML